MAISNEDWADLIARTPRDGMYGVITTGIYCRYGCASPPPLRGNALGFDSVEQARAEGLRPCKRCKP